MKLTDIIEQKFARLEDLTKTSKGRDAEPFEPGVLGPQKPISGKKK